MAARRMTLEALATIFTAPGVSVAPGDTIRLDAHQAEVLITAGFARAVAPAPPAAKRAARAKPAVVSGPDDAA